MTPEGRLKNKVKALLRATPKCYYHMPVQNGMGSPTLDFVGCFCSMYFAVETKAPGKKLTPRQTNTMDEIMSAGGVVFIVNCDDDIERLRKWLNLE